MKWQIDPAHTSVTFQIQHMGVFIVTGSFGSVAGGVITNDAYLPQRIQLEIESASIHTGNDARNAHLLSPEFFDAQQHPKILFQSAAIALKPESFSLSNLFSPKKQPRYVANGNLSMRGVVQPVNLDFEVPSEPFDDPWQAKRIGARGTTQLDRTRWGINWNQNTPVVGTMLLGNEVRIAFNTQLTLIK